MFEELSQKLENVLRKIRGEGKISESNVSESLREIRKVLLDADVNFKVVKQFIEEGGDGGNNSALACSHRLCV